MAFSLWLCHLHSLNLISSVHNLLPHVFDSDAFAHFCENVGTAVRHYESTNAASSIQAISDRSMRRSLSAISNDLRHLKSTCSAIAAVSTAATAAASNGASVRPSSPPHTSASVISASVLRTVASDVEERARGAIEAARIGNKSFAEIERDGGDLLRQLRRARDEQPKGRTATKSTINASMSRLRTILMGLEDLRGRKGRRTRLLSAYPNEEVAAQLDTIRGSDSVPFVMRSEMGELFRELRDATDRGGRLRGWERWFPVQRRRRGTKRKRAADADASDDGREE